MRGLGAIPARTPEGVGAAFTVVGPYGDLGSANPSADATLARQAGVLGLHPRRVALNRQVHGAAVARVHAATRGHRDALPADALVTDRPGLALAALAADCLPVLIWREDATAVAAAHAGWRGIVAGVVEAAAAALGDADRLGVAIGPGIGPCCYPVSNDVRGVFASRFGSATVVGEAVDLGLAVRVALERHGVAPNRISDRLACTACDPDRRFHSYRRDGATAGRHAGLVWLRGDGILGG